MSDVDCARLDRALAELGVTRLVVGHTPQPDGITSACSDRVWRIACGAADRGVASIVTMRMMVALALVAAVPGSAWAGGWYYDWTCTGECSPGQLAVSGREGGFASEDECNAARNNDYRRQLVLEAGNVGNVDFCREYGDGDAGSSSSGGPRKPLAFSGAKVGLVFGPSFVVVDGSGNATEGSSTKGLDIEMHFGNPRFGVEGGVGLWLNDPESPALPPDGTTTLLVPLVVGFTSSPMAILRRPRLELRPDLGLDFAFLYIGSCSYCGGAEGTRIGGRGKVGLDLYFGRSKVAGLAVDVIIPFFGAGDVDRDFLPTMFEINGPRYVVRLGMVVRNPNLLGW